MPYKIYKITYIYTPPQSDIAGEKIRQNYLMPARTSQEAQQTTDTLFAYSNFHKKLLENQDVRISIKEYTQRIRHPRLSANAEAYSLEARLEQDNTGCILRFIARKKQQ